ncbi:Rv3235 family protein [Nocardia sp. NPDC004568]|uniref:Rv3235 family protein n=1 Tax=Nocardia sp. NPDC004568 TaxID=3154551 RepID=UPI0033A61CEB
MADEERAAVSGAVVRPPALPGAAAPTPARSRLGAVRDRGPAAKTCVPVDTKADERSAARPSPASDCASRPDRQTLRRNRSASAGIRRAQRVGHAAARNPEPAGARAFATTSVRILLEVLDRRRPVAQLTALCTPGLVCAIGSLVAGDHAPGRNLGSAVLGNVRLFQVEERAAEMVATYQRGPRRLVLAGRIERGSTTPWKVTALRVM